MCKGNIDWLPLARPQTGDLASNPGMYPDRKLNQRPFSLQAGAQSTEPHQPGLNVPIFHSAWLNTFWTDLLHTATMK